MFRLSVVRRVGGVLLVLLLSGVAAAETEIDPVKPKNGKADELRIEVNGQFTIALPPGWTAYDQGTNVMIFASVNLKELELNERNVAVFEVSSGDLPSFVVEQLPASRGMSCEGMSKKAEKKILKIIGGDVMFGSDRFVSQDLYSETISIGDCQGLRIRGRSKWADGTEQVADLHALSDGKTLYLFTLRNWAENYVKNLEIYEEAVSTVRLAPARAQEPTELAGPAEGKARVYVFYFLGGLAGWSPVQLFDGHSYIGFVESSHCYGFDLDPGTHLLWSKTGNQKWFLRAGVKAGRTYYAHLQMMAPEYPGKPSMPTLFSAGPNAITGVKALEKINTRLAKNSFVVQEPATAEHLEAMQEELGPMIEEVLTKWDKKWANERQWGLLHETDYVK